jgi:hypothetical protein
VLNPCTLVAATATAAIAKEENFIVTGFENGTTEYQIRKIVIDRAPRLIDRKTKDLFSRISDPKRSLD